MSEPHKSEAPDDDLGFALPAPAAPSATRVVAILLGVIAVVAAAYVIGWLPKHRAHAALVASSKAAERAAPSVEIVAPKAQSSDHALVLPGSVQPLQETTIYARTDGYVKRWLVDIGDKVIEGQLLAEIDTPELDQQLAQARAQLAQADAAVAQAKANRVLSKQNLDRYNQLSTKNLVSAADVDQRQAQAHVDEANVTAAEAAVNAQLANIRRLTQLQSYAKVTAPFAGTITTRTIERGALVTATNPTALYHIATMDPVRVFVAVPQDLATAVKPDADAKVTVREYAGRAFAGKVARASGALDPATRTMNTEVRVPNPIGELMPGMYAQVALTLPSGHRVWELPATALYNDAKGTRVAVVDAAGKLTMVPVVIERDTGAAIEIASGIDGSEKIVRLASAELQDGMTVEIITPPPAPPAPTPPAPTK